MRRWLVHAPVLCRDPLIIVAVLATVLVDVLFVVLAGHTDRQVQAFWAMQPPLDLLLAYSSWRVSRIATGAIRRFWRILAAVGSLFVLGDCIQTGQVLLSPAGSSTSGGVVQTTCFALGLGVVVLAMLLHPHPGRSPRERVAFWLDSATVLIGGAVVAWCFAVVPNPTGHSDVPGTLIASGVALTSAFAAVKMTLSGNAPMHKIAAGAMIGAAVVTSVGIFLIPAEATTLSPLVYATRFLPSLLIALGPRIQEILARFDHRRAFGSRRRKPYSLLPYGSIVIAFGAMIVELPNGPDPRLWGVVVGLGVICVLVVCRQLAAFHDNARLIKRLDTTLWELREHESRLRYQAHHDGLTGLANRTHFHEEVAGELSRSTPSTVSLLLIDLDGFKEVNDTLGHAGGDALLAAVADRLRHAVRDGDLVARLGGDEFAVLLRDCAVRDAERTSQRILQQLTAPVPIRDVPVQVNASIGVAYAEHGDNVESLLRDADLAMYAAKRVGKGTWMCYDASMESTAG